MRRAVTSLPGEGPRAPGEAMVAGEPDGMEDEMVVESSELLLVSPDEPPSTGPGAPGAQGHDERACGEDGSCGADGGVPSTLPDLRLFEPEPPAGFSLLDLAPCEPEPRMFVPLALPSLSPIVIEGDAAPCPPLPLEPMTGALLRPAAALMLLVAATAAYLVSGRPLGAPPSLAEAHLAAPLADDRAASPTLAAPASTTPLAAEPPGAASAGAPPDASARQHRPPPEAGSLSVDAAPGGGPPGGAPARPAPRRPAPGEPGEKSSLAAPVAATESQGAAPQPKPEAAAGEAPGAVAAAITQADAAPVAEAAEAEFDAAHARRLLTAAAAVAALECAGEGVSGRARVAVTFVPSGKSTVASLQGGPFAGTATGSCIASKFRGFTIAPFGGAPRTVTMTVVLP